MPLSDRRRFQGLNTDDPPDRLGDQAMDCLNVVPAGGSAVRPRGGSAVETHYEPASLGRNLIADGLPHNLGNGILLAWVHSTDDGTGDTNNDVRGLFTFYPPKVSDEFDAVYGIEKRPTLVGFRGEADVSTEKTLTPTTFNYTDGTFADFAETTRDTGEFEPFCTGACLLPPGIYNGTYYQKGVLILEFYSTPASGDITVYCDAFDVQTGTRLAILSLDETSALRDSAKLYALRPYPLPKNLRGYVAVFADQSGGTDQAKIRVVRPGGTSDVATYDLDEFNVFDIAPVASSPVPAFHVAGGTTTGSASSSEVHVKFYRETIDQTDGSGTIVKEWGRKYTSGDHPNWSTSPTGCLQIGHPLMGHLNQVFGNVVALIGRTQYDVTNGLIYCERPRVCYIKGGFVNGMKETTLDFDPGDVLLSTPEGSGKAFGFALNPDGGEIYVTGNQSLADGTNNVIERYVFPNLATPTSVVAVGSNGIGDSGTPSNSRICRPVWDGSRLIVWDDNNQEFHLFRKDLTFIKKISGPTNSTGILGGMTHVFNRWASPWMSHHI